MAKKGWPVRNPHRVSARSEPGRNTRNGQDGIGSVDDAESVHDAPSNQRLDDGDGGAFVRPVRPSISARENNPCRKPADRPSSRDSAAACSDGAELTTSRCGQADQVDAVVGQEMTRGQHQHQHH
jgi:hypothetical protein